MHQTRSRARIPSWRPTRTALLLLCGAACAVSTAPGSPGVPVTGTWRYEARQLTPVDAELTGTLAITGQTGANVSGALDMTEVDARGTVRRLAGALAGRTLDSTTVDFDVTLATATRRHVGRVAGDSLTGSWIEQSAAGGPPTASGTFRAARAR